MAFRFAKETNEQQLQQSPQSAQLMSFIFYCLLFGGFPLVVWNGYTSVSYAKKHFVIALLILFAAYGATQFSKKNTQRYSIHKWLIVTGPAIATVVSSLINSKVAFFSDNGAILHILYFAAFFVAFSLPLSKRTIGGISLFPLTANAVFMTLQLSGRNPFGLYPNGLNYYGSGTDYVGEYIGTIGNADIAGIWLCSMFAFAFASYFLSYKSNKYRLLFAADIVFACYCGALVNTKSFYAVSFVAVLCAPALLIKTAETISQYLNACAFTLEGVISGRIIRHIFCAGNARTVLPLIIALPVLIAAHIIANKIKLKKPIQEAEIQWGKLYICVFIGMSVLAFLFFFFGTFPNESTFHEIHDILHLRLRPEFGSHRIQIYTESLLNWWNTKDTLTILFGYNGDIRELINITFTRNAEINGENVIIRAVVSDPHNIILNWLLNFGIIGLVSIAAFVTCAIKEAFKISSPQSLSSAFALLAYIAVEMFCVGDYITDIYFWLFAGFAMSASKETASTKTLQ